MLSIAAFFYELIFILFSWALGVCVVKTFTLGRGNAGKLRYLAYNQKKNKNAKFGLTAEELEREKNIAGRTLYIGVITWVLPLFVYPAYTLNSSK